MTAYQLYLIQGPALPYHPRVVILLVLSHLSMVFVLEEWQMVLSLKAKELFMGIFVSETRHLSLNLSATMYLTENFNWLDLRNISSALLA